MHCRAYCTATSFNLSPFYKENKESYAITQYREFLHILIPLNDHDNADVFLFNYGAAVFWGCPSEEFETRFLALIKPYEKDPYDFVENDEFTYTIGDKPRFVDDKIVLPDLEVLSLIAVSHAIAQSVKLGSFELTVHNSWNNMKSIPEQLARNGKITQSRRKIRMQMGKLFLERSWVNLHVDVLEVPEFFWDYPEIEPLYKMTAHYLEIENRVEVLNKRLDVVHELFEMLVAEQNHQHSSRLEWAIIVLIFIEISLFLVHEIFKIV